MIEERTVDQEGWLKRLKEAHADKVGAVARGLRLPRDLEFTGTPESLRLTMRPGVESKNMQLDASAFEGWATVFRHWAEVRKVTIDWSSRPQTHGAKQHYNRLCYRAHCFAQRYAHWFAIDESKTPVWEPTSFGRELIVNPAGPRNQGTDMKAAQNPVSLDDASEHDLESHIRSSSDCSTVLAQVVGLGEKEEPWLGYQLPVGLFERGRHGRPERGQEIFTGSKSAIDLWTVDSQGRAALFELKRSGAGNNKVGAITELFFYSHFVRSVQRGDFQMSGVTQLDERLQSSFGVTAYLLAPQFHPLVCFGEFSIFPTLNESTAVDIAFGAVRITSDRKKLRFERIA